MTEPAPTHLHLSTQMWRFLITGVLSAAVDFGLYLTLFLAVGSPVDTAKALSFIAGTTTAYLINRRWTFQAEGSKRTFAAVVGLYATTFVLQVGLFALVYPPLDRTYGQLAAQAVGFVIAQGVATSVNFVVQRSVIFRSARG